MSAAVVVAPVAVSSGLGLAAVLAPLAGLVILGLVVHAYTSCDKQAATGTATRERRGRLADQVGGEVHRIGEQLQGRLRPERLGARRKELEKRCRETQARWQEAVDRVRDGTVAAADVAALRQQTEAFEQEVALAEARFAQAQRLAERLRRQVEPLLDKLVQRGHPEAPRLARELAAALALPDDRVEERAQRLSALLAALEAIADGVLVSGALDRLFAAAGGKKRKARGSGPGPDDTGAAQLRQRELKQEAALYWQGLREDFPAAASAELAQLAHEAATSQDPGRLTALRDQLELVYGRCCEEQALTAFFRQRLEALRATMPAESDLGRRLAAVLARPLIGRADFAELAGACERELIAGIERDRRRMVEEKLREALSRLDYLVLDPADEQQYAERLRRSQTLLLPTRYPEYQLLLRLAEDHTLTVRLVRVVAGESDRREVSAGQKQRDQDVRKQWCQHVDVLLEDLARGGVFSFERLRVEDEVQLLTLEQVEQLGLSSNRLREALAKADNAAPRAQRHPD